MLEEVWHVERSGRAGSLDGLARRAYTVLTPLLEVDDRAFALALGVDAPALGTNDRLRSGTCAAHGIDVIVSADRGFDAVTGLRRLDLLDTAAVRALLKSG